MPKNELAAHAHRSVGPVGPGICKPPVVGVIENESRYAEPHSLMAGHLLVWRWYGAITSLDSTG